MKITFDFDGFRKEIRTKRLIEKEENLIKAAKRIGISRSTLWRCENGEMTDLMTYAKLCRWLNIPMDKHFKESK
jgi:DNA-binding XRE family transcriptional regulator